MTNVSPQLKYYADKAGILQKGRQILAQPHQEPEREPENPLEPALQLRNGLALSLPFWAGAALLALAVSKW